MSREKSMCLDALFEAEKNGVYFTEIKWVYNYSSGVLRCRPCYNSVGQRIL